MDSASMMWRFLPEITVALMACVVLLLDLYLPPARREAGYWVAVATPVVAAVFTLSAFTDSPVTLMDGLFIDDAFARLVKLAVYLFTFLAFIYSRRYAAERGLNRGEYYVLGLFGMVGMMIMVSAGNFLSLYLGLELLALCLYVMVAFQRDSIPATEAAMKYFVMGALASGMLLYGLSILYGVTGSLDIATVRAVVAADGGTVVLLVVLAFVLVSLMFELGAVPLHMWIPDVYHGGPTSTVAYIGSAPKLAGLALVIRLLVGGMDDLYGAWRDMLIVIAVLSIVLGNISAIAQTNTKRMLGYSTIAHMGYALLGVVAGTANGYSASLFYVLIYGVMSLAAFGVILVLTRAGFEADNLDDLRGLNQRSPWYAFLMLVTMFSLAGIPPTVGFYAKLVVIRAVIDVHLVWLAVVAVVMAAVGAFYYLRVVKLMYFDAAEDKTPIKVSPDMSACLSANALVLIAIMPWVNDVMAACATAISQLAG